MLCRESHGINACVSFSTARPRPDCKIRPANRPTKFRSSTSVLRPGEFACVYLSFLSRSQPNQLAAGINANCRVCKLHVCISTYSGSRRMAFTRDENENSHPTTLTSKNNFNVVFLFNFLASADSRNHPLITLMVKPNRKYSK